MAGQGFYKKTEKLNLAESRNKFHPLYELSEDTKITILRSTWKATKVIFEDNHFFIEAYSGEKLYALEDYLEHTNFKNVRIKDN